MSFRKQCDFDDCQKLLGNSSEPFLQFHGSMSEQLEEQDGVIEYRYLTPHARAKLAFCNIGCLTGWVNMERTRSSFTRKDIHREDLY